MEKIEELFLYTLEQQKQIDQQLQIIERHEAKIAELASLIDQLLLGK